MNHRNFHERSKTFLDIKRELNNIRLDLERSNHIDGLFDIKSRLNDLSSYYKSSFPEKSEIIDFSSLASDIEKKENEISSQGNNVHYYLAYFVALASVITLLNGASFVSHDITGNIGAGPSSLIGLIFIFSSVLFIFSFFHLKGYLSHK